MIHLTKVHRRVAAGAGGAVNFISPGFLEGTARANRHESQATLADMTLCATGEQDDVEKQNS